MNNKQAYYFDGCESENVAYVSRQHTSTGNKESKLRQ